jgi:SHAQKYF class myb-like DNA-binding protein
MNNTIFEKLKKIQQKHKLFKTPPKWSTNEHKKFLKGLKMYGRQWTKIQNKYIPTKTVGQIRNYAQKYFKTLQQSGKYDLIPPPVRKSKKRKINNYIPISTKNNSIPISTKKKRKINNSTPILTKKIGNWSEYEHNKFLEGLKLYGRNWSKINLFIGSRTNAQIGSHAQKYFSKLKKIGQIDLIPPILHPKRIVKKTKNSKPHPSTKNDSKQIKKKIKKTKNSKPHPSTKNDSKQIKKK